MKPGIIAAGLSAAGLCAVVFAFLSNASPYVTGKQALESRGDNLHLAGDIVPGSVDVSVRQQTVRFAIRDAEGTVVRIRYRGAPPAYMGSATKVVAVGGMQGQEFVSRKLLLKCPSKYESEGAGGGA